MPRRARDIVGSARGVAQGAPVVYRGVDRRSRNDGLGSPLPAWRVLPMSSLVALGAGLPAFSLAQPTPGGVPLEAYLAVAAGLLFVVAGGTVLVTWRMTGRALQARLGAAFVVLGVVTLLADGLLVLGHGAVAPEQAFDEALGAALGSWLLLRGVTSTEVHSGVSPLVTLSVGLGAAILAMGLLRLAQGDAFAPAWLASEPTVVVLRVVPIGAWLFTAAVSAREAVRRSEVTGWIPAIAALFALAAAVRLVTAFDPLSTLVSAAFLLLFVAAAITVGVAAVRVQEVMRAENGRELHLHHTLDATRRKAASDQANLEDWLHDLRNVVSGLQAADAALRARSNAGLSGDRSLADAVSGELARLHMLVDPTHRLELLDVPLVSLLSPIVDAERALGADVEMRTEPLIVRVDPEALGRVLQNLLENARRHAPGTRVVVSAKATRGVAILTVSDTGPGIPRGERRTVFDRGARGRDSTGSGIGLYVARSLVRAMGGTIAVATDEPPGCSIAVTLPLGDPATPSAGRSFEDAPLARAHGAARSVSLRRAVNA